MKSYIVEANRTLYIVEAASIEAAAAEILGVETANRQMMGGRKFSNGKGIAATETCTVFLSLDEIPEFEFTDRTIEATTIKGVHIPARTIQSLAA